MNVSIKKRLLKDPKALANETLSQIEDETIRANVSSVLKEAEQSVLLESSLTAKRKGLSRQIGQAKKANQDCTELIYQVSELSDRLIKLSGNIDKNVTLIEAELAKNTTHSENDTSDYLPLHMRIKQINKDDACLELNLTTSHSEDVDFDQWQSFVDATNHSTIYHDARWKSIVQKNFKHSLYNIVCTDKRDKIVGVLPLVHLKSRQFGSFTTSMPYFNYGGPLAQSTRIEQMLMNHAAELSAELGCSHMEIRETRSRLDWISTQRKVSMVLPLPKSNESLDASFGSKLRSQINKASKHGITVRFGGLELLDSFYRVFSQNMRDLGTPVYSKHVFKDIITAFPEQACIAVASLDEAPLAVGFLLGHKDKLEIPWASSIRSKNHLGANMLMYREILRKAIDDGYEYFDFGRSTRDASTHRFKKQWGATEHDLHWHYWMRDVPELNPDNPKFKIAIKVWQMLPVAVTNIIGPPIARNLP